MPFGETITRAREKNGLSKSKLAARADLSPSTIRRVEMSERSLSIETIEKAAGQLGLVVVINLVPKPEAEAAHA